MNSMCLYNKDLGEQHVPTTYELLIINNIKECSIVLLNMLDYDKGVIYIENAGDETLVNIDLIKN